MEIKRSSVLVITNKLHLWQQKRMKSIEIHISRKLGNYEQLMKRCKIKPF